MFLQKSPKEIGVCSGLCGPDPRWHPRWQRVSLQEDVVQQVVKACLIFRKTRVWCIAHQDGKVHIVIVNSYQKCSEIPMQNLEVRSLEKSRCSSLPKGMLRLTHNSVPYSPPAA